MSTTLKLDNSANTITPTMGTGISADRRGTVLIVEDDPLVSRTAARVLSRIGFSTLCARDGAQALKAVQDATKDVDVALVDLNLPQLSGTDVCLLLQDIRPGLPVVVMSGNPPGAAIKRLSLVTSAVYLQKPFTVAEMKQAVDHVLDSGKD